MRDILDRLHLDPGSLTLGQLLQDREAAAHEIRQLRDRLHVATCTGKVQRTATVEAHQSNQFVRSANVLLRLSDVCHRLGLSRSTIYCQMSEGRFPKPVQVTERSVRWRAEEIEEWLRTLHSR